MVTHFVFSKVESSDDEYLDEVSTSGYAAEHSSTRTYTPDIGSSSTYATNDVSTGSSTNALNQALSSTCAPKHVSPKSTG